MRIVYVSQIYEMCIRDRSKRILEWIPSETRRRGTPQRSWSDDVEEPVISRGLEEDICVDRKIWKLGTKGRS